MKASRLILFLLVPFLLCANSIPLPKQARFFNPPIPATGGGGGSFTYTIIAHTWISTDSATVTTPAIDTTGANLIIYGVSIVNGSFTITDNKGSPTLTKLTEQGDAFDGIRSNQICYAISPTVGTGHTFTFANSASSFSVLEVLAVKKSSGTPTFDTQNGFSQSSGASAESFQVGSVTPAGDNELIVTSAVWNNNQTPTIDSSFTFSDWGSTPTAGVNMGGLAYLIQTTGGTVNPTWSFSGNINSYGGTIAAFK